MVTVLGFSLGCVCGIAAALVPGLGSLQALLVAGLISQWLGAGAPACLVATFGCYALASSVKEGLVPRLAGNAEISLADTMDYLDPAWFTGMVASSKVLGLVVGAAAALWLPIELKSFGVGGTVVVCVVLALLLWPNLRHHWWTALLYVVCCQVLMLLLNWSGCTQPIAALGAGLILVPSAVSMVGGGSGVTDGCIKTGAGVDIMKLVLGSLVAVLTPGVGSTAVVAGLNAKVTPSVLLTTVAASMCVEGFSLVKLLDGVVMGKSALAIEVPEFSKALVWVLVGSIVVGLVMLPWVYRCYQGLDLRVWSLVSVGLGVALTIAAAGPVLGLVLIVFGLGVDYLFRITRCPATVRSLMFLGSLFAH